MQLTVSNPIVTELHHYIQHTIKLKWACILPRIHWNIGYWVKFFVLPPTRYIQYYMYVHAYNNNISKGSCHVATHRPLYFTLRLHWLIVLTVPFSMSQRVSVPPQSHIRIDQMLHQQMTASFIRLPGPSPLSQGLCLCGAAHPWSAGGFVTAAILYRTDYQIPRKNEYIITCAMGDACDNRWQLLGDSCANWVLRFWRMQSALVQQCKLSSLTSIGDCTGGCLVKGLLSLFHGTCTCTTRWHAGLDEFYLSNLWVRYHWPFAIYREIEVNRGLWSNPHTLLPQKSHMHLQ